MINGLRKVFGGVKMTWLRVIIFSVVTAFITALCLIVPALSNTALKEMGVSYEFWFIFAIFIVSNCEKPLEAGLKCFVFFLISQPLIYLFQQPFAEVDLIKSYYFRWFIQTLFTFPGGMIAFYIKKNNVLASLILAVAGAFMGLIGSYSAVNAIFKGDISYILYGLFFVFVAIVFGFVFFTDKKPLRIYLVIVIAVILVCSFLSFSNNKGSGEYEYDILHEGEWTIGEYSTSGINIKRVDDDTILIVHPSNKGSATVECTNKEGKTIILEIVVEKGKVTVNEIEN